MKRLTPLLMTLALIAVLTAAASGSGGRRTVTVVLNGKTLSFDAAAQLIQTYVMAVMGEELEEARREM